MTFLTSTLPRARTARQPLLRAILSTLIRWDAHYRSRRAIERLDAHLLDDIGYDRATKWDAPIQMRQR